VSLKLDDQGAQAHFFSSHSTVRGAVEQAIPQLREALAEQGIALGEAMVGEHRQGFAGNGDGQPGQRGAAPAGDGLAGEPAATEESVPVSRIIGGDTGGVDLYA
ncbi:MAG TPA: flagellar hook-length control protein FliK, partial [Alcanivorax sp.]|nr:flagellar hook-length control protein FliK [Alcanivorax sp.]